MLLLQVSYVRAQLIGGEYNDQACNDTTRPVTISGDDSGALGPYDYTWQNGTGYEPDSKCEWHVTMTNPADVGKCSFITLSKSMLYLRVRVTQGVYTSHGLCLAL